MSEIIFIKNHLKLTEKLKAGMILRRTWYYENPEPLERLIVEVQTNGFWVKEKNSEEIYWVDFMSAKDWAFKDGKIYMIFNHDLDKKRKEKEFSKENYNKYLVRFEKYIKELETANLPKINGYKILGIYEIVSK